MAGKYCIYSIPVVQKRNTPLSHICKPAASRPPSRRGRGSHTLACRTQPLRLLLPDPSPRRSGWTPGMSLRFCSAKRLGSLAWPGWKAPRRPRAERSCSRLPCTPPRGPAGSPEPCSSPRPPPRSLGPQPWAAALSCSGSRRVRPLKDSCSDSLLRLQSNC